jgi:hypothetical protein
VCVCVCVGVCVCVYIYIYIYIYVIRSRNSFYSSVTSLHVSAPMGHLQVKNVLTSIFVLVKTTKIKFPYSQLVGRATAQGDSG